MNIQYAPAASLTVTLALGAALWLGAPASAAASETSPSASPSTSPFPSTSSGSVEVAIPATHTTQIDGRIGFAPGSIRLDASAKSALQKLAFALRPTRYRLYFAGGESADTDRRSAALVLRRARAIRDYLTEQGLDARQMALADSATLHTSLQTPCVNQCTQAAHTLTVFAIAEVDGMLVRRGRAAQTPEPEPSATPVLPARPGTQWY